MFWLPLFLLLEGAWAQDAVSPSIEDPVVVSTTALAGVDITLECVVNNLGNQTVLWRRLVSGTDQELLTVSNYRVVEDGRVSVYHEDGHPTWVLALKSVKSQDSGRYICEVNTSPPIQTYFLVTVIGVQAVNISSALSHNYTDCCVKSGVSYHCIEYCSFHNILTGGLYTSPWQCTNFLPSITKCMADGRDHTPCCERQKIPEICRSVCRGDFDLTTVLQHSVCSDHTASTLACISEGIELLPGPPQQLFVEPLSESQLKVTWSVPFQTTPVTHFELNVTKLVEFDAPGAREGKDLDLNVSQPLRTVKLAGNNTSYVIQHLQPFTMYEIQVKSMNKHGMSIPSYAVRTLTMAPNQSTASTSSPSVTVPTLPDIIGCCAQKGVKLSRCRRVLCDPTKADTTRITDVMICAPWANVTFECMSGGVDHSGCCMQRGVPEVCLAMCRGNVTRLDFRHFICLDYMADYSNCLLEHYGVLAGPPQEVTVTAVHSNWAVIQWKGPKTPHPVSEYVLQWRKLDSLDGFYTPVLNVKSPYLLDGLEPDSRYEAFVVAMNEYGASQPSARELFTTNPLPMQETSINEPGTAGYNETWCCLAAGLREHCLPLCTYNVKMSELLLLGPLCMEELSLLVRCGAGGRNHTPCCQRRMVSPSCYPMCAGHAGDISPIGCSADLGKILQCMSEGTEIIPEPPNEFRTSEILPTEVKLSWQPVNASDTSYTIYYTPLINSTALHPSLYNTTLNVTTTTAIVDNLVPNNPYSFYVVARNEHGSSLPSLVINVKTPSKSGTNPPVEGTISPPHNVEVPHQTVDSLLIRWSPPLHVPTDAFLSYLVLYKANTKTDDFESTSSRLATTQTSLTLVNLTINTEYAIAVRARTGSGQSDLSETIFAWTDPAIPALVNPPVIIPGGNIIEGMNITFLCIGMGIPVPTVSLYINGRLRAQQKQRHLAWSIPRISRNVTHVACFADNAFGIGAHSTLPIRVSFRPSIATIAPVVKAPLGSSSRLQCVISGHPEPKIQWFRDPMLKEPIQEHHNLETSVEPHPETPATYLATLAVKKVRHVDEGLYFCTGNNNLGSSNLSVQLVIDEQHLNTTDCCKKQGVSEACMDACTFDIDIQVAITRPTCLQDIHKLMFCAADGSDHQQCCRNRNVPRGCLRWCRGNPVSNIPVCILAAAKDIVACFEEGKSVLPGQPINVKVLKTSTTSVRLMWEPPLKNSELVQWYRIIWRPVGSREYFRNQTTRTTMELADLELDKTYEIIIKAGNHYGMSLNTDPTLVQVEEEPHYASYQHVMHIILGILISLIVVGVAVAIVMFYKNPFKSRTDCLNNGVSFENPTYLKDSISMQPTESSRAVANIYEEPKACSTSP